MAKIVAVDTDFEDNNLEEAMARDAGIEFEVTCGRTAQAVINGLLETGADAAVTSYAMFPREVFEACPNLKAVSRTGVGYDEIDVEAATEYGVAVCNVPGYGTEVVSDHAITLALSVLRRINELDADMRRGVWDYARTRPLGQCRGRVFGVVGMGEIGRAAAKKAAGLGLETRAAYSRRLPRAAPGRAVAGGGRGELAYGAYSRDTSSDQRRTSRPHEAGCRAGEHRSRRRGGYRGIGPGALRG